MLTQKQPSSRAMDQPTRKRKQDENDTPLNIVYEEQTKPLSPCTRTTSRRPSNPEA